MAARTLGDQLAAEKKAEEGRIKSEALYRKEWWATTWALAAVPKSEWASAQAQYVTVLGHSKDYAKDRRMTGTRLPESGLATTLPKPRMAIAAATALGAVHTEAQVTEMVALLAKAESDEMSLREFSLALTGKDWSTGTLSEAQEEAIVTRVAAERPEIVATAIEAAPTESKVTVAKAALKDRRALDRTMSDDKVRGEVTGATSRATIRKFTAEKAKRVEEKEAHDAAFFAAGGVVEEPEIPDGMPMGGVEGAMTSSILSMQMGALDPCGYSLPADSLVGLRAWRDFFMNHPGMADILMDDTDPSGPTLAQATWDEAVQPMLDEIVALLWAKRPVVR